MMYVYIHVSHQTCWVEFLFAGAATLLRQGVVGAMDNREANHTVFYSLETLIHIVLPQTQAFHNTAILNTNTHFNCFNFFLFWSLKQKYFHTPLGLPCIEKLHWYGYNLATSWIVPSYYQFSCLLYIQCFYLMCEVCAQLQHPVPPLLYGNAHSPPTLYSNRA